MGSPKYLRFLPRVVSAAMALGAFGLFSQAVAVEPRVYQLENGGAIAPHLTIEVGHDSNPLRAETGSASSAFVRILPEVSYILQRRSNNLTFSYNGDFLQYFNDYCTDPTAPGFGNTVSRPGDCATSASTELDRASFQNHTLGVSGFFEFSRRVRGTLVFGSSLVNQPLGVGLSALESVLTSIEETDSSIRNTGRIGISYGANQARGELRFALAVRDRRFRNNGRNLSTDLNETSVEPSARILYRVGSKTKVFADVSAGDVTGGNSERTIFRQSIGAEFDAPAITSGSVQVSAVQEDFDNTAQNDLSFVGFDVDIEWRPRRFSTVTVGAGRETGRGGLTESVSLATTLDVEWLHFWRERVSTAVQIVGQFNDSDTEVDNDANDRAASLRLGGNYNLLRWLDIGAFVQGENRTGTSSNGESRDFSRTLVGLTANGTF